MCSSVQQTTRQCHEIHRANQHPDVYKPSVDSVPLSHASLANGFIYVMGCGARNVDGSIEGDDIRTQGRKCMSNAQKILAACGADFSHAVSITTYMVRLEDTDGFNEVYREFINIDPPSRAMVFIKGFRDPRMLVEVVVTALDPR